MDVRNLKVRLDTTDVCEARACLQCWHKGFFIGELDEWWKLKRQHQRFPKTHSFLFRKDGMQLQFRLFGRGVDWELGWTLWTLQLSNSSPVLQSSECLQTFIYHTLKKKNKKTFKIFKMNVRGKMSPTAGFLDFNHFLSPVHGSADWLPVVSAFPSFFTVTR